MYELPPELQKKMYDYTNANWSQTKGFETNAMLSHLPTSVKAEIMLFGTERSHSLARLSRAAFGCSVLIRLCLFPFSVACCCSEPHVGGACSAVQAVFGSFPGGDDSAYEFSGVSGW